MRTGTSNTASRSAADFSVWSGWPPSRAGAPSLRCYQNGAKVVDNELPPGTAFGAEPPAGAVQLRSPGGQRVWLLPMGEGLCLVRLQAATATATAAAAEACRPGNARA